MEKGIARSQFDASLQEDSAQTAGAHMDTTVNVAVVPVPTYFNDAVSPHGPRLRCMAVSISRLGRRLKS